MSRKDLLTKTLSGRLGTDNPLSQQKKPATPIKIGAIASMSLALNEITQEAETAADLQQKLESGDAVVELDPKNIEGSIINDRLQRDIDPEFEDLVKSIDTQGQQVPILVRPHPTKENSFQAAYGHRRIRALTRLGKPVRAVVQEMSDDELVIAQGNENFERTDLSYIGKAIFAQNLSEHGFARNTIMAALSIDKSDLSRYISVAKKIPNAVAKNIGPAPKIGRSRWLLLVDILANDNALKTTANLSKTTKFLNADSDARFQLVFDALAVTKVKSPPAIETWAKHTGEETCKIEYRKDRTILTIDERQAPEFGAYVTKKLDKLYEDFLSQQNATNK